MPTDRYALSLLCMCLYRNGGGMKFDMTPPEKRDDASMVVPGLDWLPETTVTGLANFGEEDEDGEKTIMKRKELLRKVEKRPVTKKGGSYWVAQGMVLGWVGMLGAVTTNALERL